MLCSFLVKNIVGQCNLKESKLSKKANKTKNSIACKQEIIKSYKERNKERQNKLRKKVPYHLHGCWCAQAGN